MSRLRSLLFLLPILPVSAAFAASVSEVKAVGAALETHPSIQSARSAIIAAQGLQAEADFL